ncbi:hypothetical protein Trydic_g21394 [Trypoxylus dichotomus]
MLRQQWLSEKSSALLDEDERITTLNEIRDYLQALPQDEAVQSTQLLQMPVIFDCLNDSNTEQIDLACEVLTLCLNTLSLGESTNRYNVPLERSLKHPHSQFTPLLNMVIRCIGNDDLGVATLSSSIITTIGASESGINILLSSDVRNVLTEVMGKNEVVRLRFFEVFINVARKSEISHNILKSSSFLSQILHDLDNNDVLLRMNIIELLSQFVTCEQGYTYLETNGVMEKFCEQLKDSDDILFVQLCEPGILKFFGQLAYWRPNDIVTKYKFVLSRIYSNIESDNFTLVGVSVDTLGHISETNEGKIALNSIDVMPKLLSCIIEKLNKLPNEVKIRALNCIENILQVSTNDTRITTITRKWYSCLEGNPMDFIMRYAKNPFSEIRCAGLGLLSALATQLWGQEVIRNSPGLVEFLLDRNVETIKECKELKFEIVSKLSTSEVFNHDINLRLQAFVKEGPFYVQGVTEVAIEGNE